MQPNGHPHSRSLKPPRLRSILDQFRGRRVLVVGDCMLDEYLWGRVNRISPEAPVMVVEQVRRTYAAGGASNVAANIVAMEGEATLVAVVGDDPHGAQLRVELEREGVCADGLVVSHERPTTLKTRIMAHHQQVLRVDHEDRTAISSEVAGRLAERTESLIRGVDALLFSDYSKGVLTEQVIAELTGIARAAGKPVFANPKPSSVRHYRKLSLLTLNQSEAEASTGMLLSEGDGMNEPALAAAGDRLIEMCQAEAVVVTLGGRGLALFEAGQPWRHLPVVPLEVYDPCGCGDSAIAAAALARTAGADWVEAATVANLAGNAKVRKLGVVPVTRQEIESVWLLGHSLANGSAESTAAGKNGLSVYPEADRGRKAR